MILLCLNHLPSPPSKLPGSIFRPRLDVLRKLLVALPIAIRSPLPRRSVRRMATILPQDVHELLIVPLLTLTRLRGAILLIGHPFELKLMAPPDVVPIAMPIPRQGDHRIVPPQVVPR